MNKLCIQLISLFYAWVAILSALGRLIRVGKHKYFHLKPRDTPPPCLLDPGLGRHGYVKLKDVKLHYVMNGDVMKPLLVLLHGFPEFWFSWRYQLREFSREYCVVAVDMRGFGDSDRLPNEDDYVLPRLVDDVYQLIKHFTGENGKAVVMAHDWGGFIAYALAAKYPEVVKKLIVGNAPHPTAFAKTLQSTWTQFLKSWYIFYFRIPYVADYLLMREDLVFLNKLFTNGKNSVMSNDELEAYKYIYSRPGAITSSLNYYRANITSSSRNITSDASRISVPTLLIWGDRDLALSMLTATTSSEYIDEFHLRVIEGGSHWIQMEKHDEFNSHAWNFLKNS